MATISSISVKDLARDLKKKRLYKTQKKAVFEAVADACLESIPKFAAISPVDTGLYANSWEVKQDKYKTVFFGNTAPYAFIIEKGARPFSPPIGPLLEWAARKLKSSVDDPAVKGLAWGVKRKIEREGMPPRHIMENGLEKIIMPKVKRNIKNIKMKYKKGDYHDSEGV